MATRDAFRQFILRGVHVTENELGRGSYAVVLELRYQGLKCAGKKLYRVLYESGIGHAARRYLEECQLLSQTRHPHIVQFIGVFFEEGTRQFPILVMEFLPTNLSSCLDRYGILSDEISYSILHDVSLGLSYLHGQIPPIVHRDLSANNVLLSKEITAKISDLGVSKILDLTPLQVSRMTETPGTPAYMPPEVMAAAPRYDTSVDVFSFGVMMIHTFTAEWPLPKVGQTRIDPANPDRLIPVTEAERREEFLRKIVQEHPLMDLIMRCLRNNPQQRPRAKEIVGRMGDVVLQYPPSFENRVEMLQRISTLDTEKRELEQEIVRKNATIQEKAREIKRINEEKIGLNRVITRRDSIIEENKRLSEERIQQKKECEKIIERLKEASSVEASHKIVENEHMKGQLEVYESLMADLRALNKGLAANLEKQVIERQTDLNSFHSKEIALTAEVRALTEQVSTLTSHIEHKQSVNESSLAAKDIIIATKESVIASQEADITAKESSLQTKEATIQSMSAQLERTHEYLTNKPQPLQVQLSCSQCSHAPVKMSGGTAITINGKIYYGGGICELTALHEYYITCYSPSHDKWSSLPKLPVRYFGIGKINNELVAVGGCKIRARTNELMVFSTRGRIWKQTIPPMPTARNSPAVVSLPTQLVVAGGWYIDTKQVTDTVEMYNVNSSQWTKTDRLPCACGNPRVTVCKDTVYLLGGWDGSNRLNAVVAAQVDQLIANSVPAGQQEDRNHRHSAEQRKSAWKKIANTPSYRASTVAVSDIVLAIGGVNSADIKEFNPAQGVYAYSSLLDFWVYIGDLPSARTYAATVSLSLTEFLIICGRDEHFTAQNTVCKATYNSFNRVIRGGKGLSLFRRNNGYSYSTSSVTA